MKHLSIISIICLLKTPVFAQYTYTIKADSVKITSCDSSELILENHTQDLKGFLYNTGNGRTLFRKGLIKVNDSLYLIGADSLKYNAWVQGGNAFGGPGVLGTRDNNHMDLYSNGLQRGRLTNTGHWLLGTTADNGNTLQVDGPGSFSGNLGIGSATITNTGDLIGTNALLFNYVVSKYHNYRSNSDPYIGRLENLLYAYDTRFTTVRDTSGGVYTIDITIPASEITPGYAGLVYPQGFMCFSFWNSGIPESVSVMMKDSLSGTWMGPFTSNSNIGFSGAGFFQVGIPGNFNWVTEIKVTFTPPAGMPVVAINLQDMEYVASNGGGGLSNPNPYVSKDAYEYLYYPLFMRNAGVDNVMISPAGTSYFQETLLVGSNTNSFNGAKLQVTGDVSATGNLTCGGSLALGTTSPAAQLHTTGAVRFAGLTNDNTQTRVLVSDAYGDLYYRDISTLTPASFSAVASTATVASKGPDVETDHAMLLKRIAEVRLYATGLEKKLEELDALKKEVADLRRMLMKGSGTTNNANKL